MTRQRKSFMNIDKNGDIRSENEDRIIASDNFAKYINDLTANKTKVNAKRNNITDLISSALSCNNNALEDELLNSQWNEYIKNIGELPNMIAMVDVSGSMEGIPMLAAIGLGLCISNKSKYGKRVLTFSEHPSLVELDSCENFVDMVIKIRSSPWGTTTNFYSALKLVLYNIIENNMSHEDVKDLTLVILSDMQINQADNKFNASMMDTIRDMYHTAGININGVPYDPPHILFWNLRSTDNFPNISSCNNTTMLSGYSPQMLNEFIKGGLDRLKTITPFKMLLDILNNPRYDIQSFNNVATEYKNSRQYINDNINYFIN